MIESGQQIPSSWMATTDHETSTHAFSEVMAIPQIYSNAQPHPIRVELGNDGQQYMIVDSKYLSQNTEGIQTYICMRKCYKALPTFESAHWSAHSPPERFLSSILLFLEFILQIKNLYFK